jgi:CelD/BcsL family acetyltransferase involved in cellulose biosynthesis
MRTVQSWADADLLWLRRARADSALERLWPANQRLEMSAAPFVPPCAAPRSKNRKRLETKRSKLAERGPVAFDLATGAQASEWADAAIRLKCRWLQERGLLLSPVFEPAWRDCVVDLAGSTAGLVARLSVGERPIAFEIGFRHGDHYASWLGAFEAEFAAWSPGRLLTDDMIRWCKTEGLVYDLLPPEDAHKLEHTSESMSVATRSVPLTLRGQFAEWIIRTRPLAKAVYSRLPAPVRRLLGQRAQPA